MDQRKWSNQSKRWPSAHEKMVNRFGGFGAKRFRKLHVPSVQQSWMHRAYVPTSRTR